MATKMYGDRFRSIQELTEIFKHHGMNMIDAENTAKREIKRKYKTNEAYLRAKYEYKESSRLEKGEQKLIEKIENEYLKIKNSVKEPQARRFYNQAYRRYLTKFKDLTIADHYARVDLEKFCQDNKLEINTLDADQILSQIGVDNPNLDITTISEYDTIVDSLDSGMNFKESYDLAVNDTVMTNKISEQNYKDLSYREQTFKNNLSQKDLEFANTMKTIQPDMSWSYEKVYRMYHDDNEVKELINNIPPDKRDINIDNLPSVYDIAMDSNDEDDNDVDSNDENIDDDDYYDDDYDDTDYEYEEHAESDYDND
jgi:hypothetical protein